MVRASLDMLTTSELGSVAISVLSDSDFPQGSLLLELIYIVDCIAPAELEAKRFLPATPIRLLLDAKGNNHAGEYTHAALYGSCLAKDRKTAAAVIKSRHVMIKGMLQRGDLVAGHVAKALAGKAQQTMQNTLKQELDRLHYLAQLSPNVREEELTFIQHRMDWLDDALQRASVRLDAVRVIICS